jgi:ferric-dicitrate binding protein FerR (iron transport regulator)
LLNGDYDSSGAGQAVTERKIIPSTIFALVSLLFSLVILGAASPSWAQTAGSITAISGTATIERAGATIPAAYGTKVNVGDRIVTAAASNLTITLTDNSQVELTDSSNLTIDQNTLNASGSRDTTKLTLLTGLVRSLVRTTPGTPPNYEVHTPNAVASARGTNYDVDHETGKTDSKYKDCTEFTHVLVYAGNVEVYNPTNPSAPPVQVKEGQKVTVPCGLAPTFGGGAFGFATGAAIGGLSLLGAGAIAVIVLGATGQFGGGNNGPASPVQ